MSPKREIRPAEPADPKETEARLERDRARQANYDAQAERNAEALGGDPAQQELYRREREGGRTLLGDEPKRADGAPENKRAANPGENKLEGVQFASPAARAAADEAGLTADAFKRKRKSSEKGFTAADVERISAASGEAEE